jgi:uncharacterized protein (DUF1800 family)
MSFTRLKWAPGALALALLSACGGSSNDSTTQAVPASQAQLLTSTVNSGTGSGSALVRSGGATEADALVAPTQAAAAHLLAQASFGPTMNSIADVTARGQSGWIDSQFQVAQTLHRNHLVSLASTMLAAGAPMTQNQVFESFWKQAVTGNDQLRQRMTFALSQIFVISGVDGNVASHAYGIASYYDTLGQYAFGNFRDLLQAVALHPMMGIYLSHLRNQKENGARVPDENFAREVMQLMTIGLHQLNQDGTEKTNNGEPIDTYSHDDIAGLAKVFTGWSWAGPDKSTDRFLGPLADPARDWTPMQNYPLFHSVSEKRFLGVTVGAGGSGEADLKIALDTLFQHPNVGPFFGRLLIQRLVSSNPSPAYVGRVAAAFANNGSGVRGDMKAVIRAVLLDPEAAGTGLKIREPVVRLANWMRAFNARSLSTRFLITKVDDPLMGVAQNPLRSPSVFNFFRPNYTPPNSSLAAAGMVAPEMQITAEPSVAGYLNYMQNAIQNGIGTNRDVVPDYTAELALASQPSQLVERINLLLLNGAISPSLRSTLETAVSAVPLPAQTSSNTSFVATQRQNRVGVAIFLTMASPEYLVQ